MPWIGHLGIADSEGKVHDFAGPYFIGVRCPLHARLLRVHSVSWPLSALANAWSLVRVVGCATRCTQIDNFMTPIFKYYQFPREMWEGREAAWDQGIVQVR